ncbi:MAG: hypothetical protein A2X08_07380 [Bacteroidetes bacterium GWA2_32_17]|nr:MAG: hypothetical protein A2X08_07380 [Bacteroidetes bacterium GWA2_32_17]
MIEIIHSDQRLGEIGTDMLLSKHNTPILVLTNRARWIKTKLENNKVVSANHLELESHLEKLASEYHNKIYSGYNAKVLLLKNPMKKNSTNSEAIKLLIKAGADVKYLASSKETYRLLITENKLFFSYSDSQRHDLVVNKGFYYICPKLNDSKDTLIEYYKKEFYRLFNKGRLLKLNRKGKIVYNDNILMLLYSSLFEISTKDIIITLLGSIIGIILTLLIF